MTDDSMHTPVDHRQLFSVDQANRMLPLIRRIVADIVKLSEVLDERQCRLESFDYDSPDFQYPSADFEKWNQLQEEMDVDEDQLEEFLAELADLGVELQNMAIGEVDFRTRVDGCEAFLCWRLGEPEVACWHTEEEGFEGRRKLPRGITIRDDLLARNCRP